MAAALAKSERVRQADEFLSVAVWKLISFNSTTAPSGASPRFRMRLFAKGCPRHALREVHEALAKSNPVRDPVVDGVAQPGTYYHRGVGYLKDERTSEAGTATYTLVRDFFDGPVSESDVVEDGCGSKTSIRFEWDRAEVEDLATLANSLGGAGGVSPQGTAIRIAGVSRDPETGLLSYYVTVTETKTIIFPEFTASVDAFSTETEATWLGLLGTAASPIDSNTDAAPSPAVPAAGVSPNGTLTQVGWSKNRDDCTLNAQVKKSVAVQDVTVGQSCVKTLFEHRDGLSVRAASGALGAAPAPSNGLIVNNKDTLRPDKLWDTDKDTTQELYVAGARVSSDVTAFETDAVTVSRSQVKGQAPEAAAADGVIRSVTVEKTPGDRENVTVSVKTELPGLRAATDTEDAFSEEYSVEDVDALALGSAPAASSGEIVSHTDRNTPGGLFNRRKVTRKEKTGARGSVKAGDAFESTVVTEDVSATALGVPPAASGGVVTDHSDQNTPGGLFSRRKTVKTELTGQRAATDTEDAFSEEYSVEDVSAVALGDAPAPAAGEIVTHTDRNTPGGLFNRRKVTRKEKTGTREVVRRKNRFETSVVTEDVDSVELGAPPEAVGGVVTDHLDQNTPGGLFRRRKTVSTDIPGPRVSVTDKTAFDVTEVTDDVAFAALGEAPAAAGGVTASYTDTDMPSGLVARRKRIKRETPVEASSETISTAPWGSYKTVSDKSIAVKKTLSPGTYGRVSNTLTPGGMYDREIAQLVPGSVKAGTVLVHTKDGDMFSTTEIKETIELVKAFGTIGLTNAGVPGAASIREVTFTLNEDGTYRKRETVRTAADKIWIEASYSYAEYKTNPALPDITVSRYHYQFRNASEAEARALMAQGVVVSSKVQVSFDIKVNEFGLYGGSFNRVVKSET